MPITQNVTGNIFFTKIDNKPNDPFCRKNKFIFVSLYIIEKVR